MKTLIRLLSARLDRGIDLLLGSMECEAAAVYVAGVRKARGAFIGLLLAILVLLLMMIGFLLIHVALFLWLPWSVPARALLLAAFGVLYLGGGLAVVAVVVSERTWVRFSGVDRLLARLLSPG